MKIIYKIIILGAILLSLIVVYIAAYNIGKHIENDKNRISNKCDTVFINRAYGLKEELDRIRNATIVKPLPDDVLLVTVVPDTNSFMGSWLIIENWKDMVFRQYYEYLHIDVYSNVQPIDWSLGMKKGYAMIDPNNPIMNTLPLGFISGKHALYAVFQYKNDNWVANYAVYTTTGTMIGGKISVKLSDLDFSDVTDEIEKTGTRKHYVDGHFY